MDAQQQPSHASLVSPSFHQYERLSDIASPGPGSPRARYDLWRTEDDDEDDDYFSTRRKARSSWFQRITNFGRPPEPAVQSNYLTLIPLSGETTQQDSLGSPTLTEGPVPPATGAETFWLKCLNSNPSTSNHSFS